MTREQKLEKALVWALGVGAHYCGYNGTFDGYGCGCCSGTEEPPADVADVVQEAAAQVSR